MTGISPKNHVWQGCVEVSYPRARIMTRLSRSYRFHL
uniref:Uncharacterized protein n=1 Tax=Arundo donax TaxID=35708 RepID=A0A0A9FH87_ARUDO